MPIVQLIGYAAFIVASLVLGTRLLLLWRRTRKLPELFIGLAYLLAGGIGFIAWLVVGVLIASEAPDWEVKFASTVGLAFTVLGALCNGLGTVSIFRPGRAWAKIWVGCVGLAMVSFWILYLGRPALDVSDGFWWPVLAASPLYVWGAVEALSLASTLRKRARLGLGDPMVADRALQLGVSGLAVVVCIAINYAAALKWGLTPPAWTATLASGVLLIGAGAIWLGFFTPATYRARVQRRFEAS